MNYLKTLNRGRLILKAAEIEECDLDARLLLEYVCKTDRSAVILDPDRELTESEESEYEELLKKRASHIPLQHLTGIQGFMGLDFCVNKDVLIPRQDTESLVEEVMKEMHDGMRILDMCTGSGCILLSLLHYSNDCIGVGADISPAALSVAKKNAERLGIEAEFVESDLFENVDGVFDIIVSNPPYIRTCEIEELMPEVKDHDPFIALNGKEDGVTFYRRIIKDAPDHLVMGGLLAFEIGNDQGKAVSDMMNDAGFTGVCVLKDLCGNDRVVLGRKRIDV
ncbi:MAG: peptide chain release factor N(5)-glutamine methyltransferase [Lachnospiraceae bacterium]|nr:peptide chain release factor N(5)-glutamine methyltransferase [Lachnospiraceae bacterium]